ncbi:hypothetical protein AAG906_035877 [Vitis piasezkii]
MMFRILSNCLNEILHQEIPLLLRVINSICFNAQRTKLRRKDGNILYASAVGSLIEQKISCSHIKI